MFHSIYNWLIKIQDLLFKIRNYNIHTKICLPTNFLLYNFSKFKFLIKLLSASSLKWQYHHVEQGMQITGSLMQQQRLLWPYHVGYYFQSLS